MVHPLIGRDEDLARVRRLLDERRAVVLVGTGGVGKTALARAVVGAHHGPVAWVDAESADTVDSLSEALGSALGVAALPGEVFGDVLAAVLAELPTALIAVDGVERLAGSIPAWVAHLGSTVMWLFTSREPLAGTAMPTVRLAPLPLGDGPGGGSAGELLARLVAERGGDVDPRAGAPPVVDELLRRTGGLPLAIELTAAAIARFGATVVAGAGRLAGAAEVEAVVERSLALIGGDAPQVLEACAITVDGASLEVIAGYRQGDLDAVAETVGRLLDHGLVGASASGIDVLPPVRRAALRRVHDRGGLQPAIAQAASWMIEALPAGVGDVDQAVHLVHLAADSAVDARLVFRLAQACFTPLRDGMRNREALAVLRRADELAGDLVGADEAVDNCLRAAVSASECDTIAAAHHWLERADRCARQLDGADAVRCRIQSVAAELELDRGRLAEAERSAGEAIRLGGRAGEAFYGHQARQTVAMVELRRGRLNACEAIVDAELAWAQTASPFLEIWLRLIAAEVLAERGNARAAGSMADDVAARCEHGPDEIRGLAIVARLVAAESDPTVARPLGRVPPEHWTVALRADLLHARALAATDADAAVHLATDVAVRADLVPLPFELVGAHVLLGELALDADEHEQAAADFARAARVAATVGYHLRLADALDGFAAATASPDAAGFAAALRRESGAQRRVHVPTADVTLTRTPAAWLSTPQAVSDAVAMILGATRRRSTGGSPAERLTGAERQVAALAADGWSASEIARRLFVSRRTIESHLASIYRKYSVSSREQWRRRIAGEDDP